MEKIKIYIETFGKRELIIAGLGFVLIGLIFFGNFIGQKSSQEINAWVEVMGVNVYKMDAPGGNILQILQTGDQVQKDDIIQTGLDSTANIYVSDGSVIRVSPNTEFVLDEVSFNKKNKRLDVQIQLNKGKIWSKVFELVTPDSVWKVRTTNTVATVRGTAFGVEFKDGVSTVTGSENTVEVSVINPQTQKVVKGNTAMVVAGSFIKITDAEAELVEKEEKVLEESLEERPENIFFEEKWIREHEDADEDYNLIVKALEESGLERDEIHDEFIKDVEERYKKHHEDEDEDKDRDEDKDKRKKDEDRDRDEDRDEDEDEDRDEDRDEDEDEDKKEEKHNLVEREGSEEFGPVEDVNTSVDPIIEFINGDDEDGDKEDEEGKDRDEDRDREGDEDRDREDDEDRDREDDEDKDREERDRDRERESDTEIKSSDSDEDEDREEYRRRSSFLFNLSKLSFVGSVQNWI